ncbi:MAG: crossover junction endodeoxyribonuclease RuvC [Deltaproteobacteria bacterium]|nr:crossover junction endodeoxyribonuclease RuvC [Deltaproteobacteria bacterium]MCL5793032.1 crossover junction endodeoxyribonuclease RuvC [Deltaproteobacteria bacterium]
MIILGIDPGSNIMGWAVIEQINNGYGYTSSGVINLKNVDSLQQSLKSIYWEIGRLIELYHPGAVAIETAFFSKNQRSAFIIVQSATAAMLASLNKSIPLYEYQPMMIKKALTGYGNATKDQVQFMVKRLLGLNGSFVLDASDAMAVAICHINSIQLKNRFIPNVISH